MENKTGKCQKSFREWVGTDKEGGPEGVHGVGLNFKILGGAPRRGYVGGSSEFTLETRNNLQCKQ